MNGLDELKQEMLRPNSDLEPLMRFRGSRPSSRHHSFWNFFHAMRLNECESLTDGTALYRAGELPHLCGFHSKEMQLISLKSFASRLRLTPKVTDLVSGFTDYIAMLCPTAWQLQITGSDILPTDARWSRGGFIRKHNNKVLRNLNQKIGKSSETNYLVSAGKAESELMAAVHAAVPIRMSAAIRNDLCQDLVCAVLAGEIKIENLPDEVAKYKTNANKFYPHAYGDFYKHGKTDHNSNTDHHCGANEWKRSYIPEPLTLEDQVDLLRQQWSEGEEPDRPDLSIPSPKAKTYFKNTGFDGAQKRAASRRA